MHYFVSVALALLICVPASAMTLSTAREIAQPPPDTLREAEEADESANRWEIRAKQRELKLAGEEVRRQAREREASAAAAEKAEQKRGPAIGDVGLVCAIVGIFVAGIPLGVAGVVFGAISLDRVNREKRRGKGVATAAIVIGILAAIGALLVVQGVIGDGEGRARR